MPVWLSKGKNPPCTQFKNWPIIWWRNWLCHFTWTTPAFTPSTVGSCWGAARKGSACSTPNCSQGIPTTPRSSSASTGHLWTLCCRKLHATPWGLFRQKRQSPTRSPYPAGQRATYNPLPLPPPARHKRGAPIKTNLSTIRYHLKILTT